MSSGLVKQQLGSPFRCSICPKGVVNTHMALHQRTSHAFVGRLRQGPRAPPCHCCRASEVSARSWTDTSEKGGPCSCWTGRILLLIPNKHAQATSRPVSSSVAIVPVLCLLQPLWPAVQQQPVLERIAVLGGMSSSRADAKLDAAPFAAEATEAASV